MRRNAIRFSRYQRHARGARVATISQSLQVQVSIVNHLGLGIIDSARIDALSRVTTRRNRTTVDGFRNALIARIAARAQRVEGLRFLVVCIPIERARVDARSEFVTRGFSFGAVIDALLVFAAVSGRSDVSICVCVVTRPICVARWNATTRFDAQTVVRCHRIFHALVI